MYVHGVECFTMIIEKVFQCQLLRNFDRENQNVQIHSDLSSETD